VLEKGGLTGKYDKTMVIFSLKQLGWRDKIEAESKVEFDSDGFMEALKGQVKETFSDSGGIVEE
jgi:hypothetical protein